MNTHILFDKFAYVDRLRQAGVDEALARAHGDGLEQALREEVATKSDLKDVEVALRSEFVAVRSEIKDVEFALRSEIKDATASTISTLTNRISIAATITLVIFGFMLHYLR